MEFILVAVIAFALGFFVCGRLEKQQSGVTPKSGGGPGEEQDGGGP